MTEELFRQERSPEEYGRGPMQAITPIVEKLSEMHETERAFLTGLLLRHKPRKVLELGVSSGAGTVVILNALRQYEGAHLYSVDLLEKYYRDPAKLSGWMADESMPELKDMRTVYLGKDISEVIEAIGGGIDFLVLDTAHIHPVETLNFLCTLPYLAEGAIVVLHDISLHLQKKGFATASYACRLLYATVAAEKIIPAERYAPHANIGAYRICADTLKYAKNLFLSLYLPWGRLHAKPWRELVPHDVINSNADLFLRCYGQEYREMFLDAVKAQDDLRKEVSLFAYLKMLCGESARAVVKRIKK